MLENRVTIRLLKHEAVAITTIANALRTDRNPFVTRTDALKFALSVVAKDPEGFIAALGRRPDERLEGAWSQALTVEDVERAVGQANEDLDVSLDLDEVAPIRDRLRAMRAVLRRTRRGPCMTERSPWRGPAS